MALRTLVALVAVALVCSACVQLGAASPRHRGFPPPGVLAPAPPRAPAPQTADAEDTDDEVTTNIPLWPLLEWTETAAGAQSFTALLLFGLETRADDSVESIRILTYYDGPDATLVVPFYYDLGPADASHEGVVPLGFWGPGYNLWPLLLSGRWQGADGSRSTWITPLYHETLEADGSLRHRHMLLWFETPEGWYVPPLSYGPRADGDGELVIFPFWIDHAQGWSVPLLLTVEHENAHGGNTLWITPFYRHATAAEGPDSFHVLTYFQGPGYKLLFPVGYVRERDGETDVGVLPFYLEGRDWWALPLLLSGRWGPPHERSTWITPLFHHTRRADAPDSFHLLNYFQGPGYQLLFPLAYRVDGEAGVYQGLLPLIFGTPDGWLAPLLLSGSWQDGESARSTWITPLFHHTERDDAPDSFHLLTYIQGPGYKVLFPLAYSVGPPGEERRGLLPLWIDGPGFWAVPPLLTASWDTEIDARTTWITPLFHYTARPSGPDSFHLLNYFQGPESKVFFPLAYALGPEDERYAGVLPAYMSGPDWWLSPILLSGRFQHEAGAETTWITPLFHHTARPEAEDSFHVLNYFQGPEYRVFFPLAYSLGTDGARQRGLIPLYMDGPGGWIAPVGLSGGWRARDGASHLWITPLFHQTHDEQGALRHRHLLNYVETPSLTTLFPLYWDWRDATGAEHSLLAPLYWQRRSADGAFDALALPPLFGYREGAELDTSLLRQSIPFSYQQAGDDWEFNLLWRLFHRRVQDDVSTTVVGPLWYSETRPGLPLDYKLLGGLVARDVFESRGTYRNRFLWFFSGAEQPLPGG